MTPAAGQRTEMEIKGRQVGQSRRGALQMSLELFISTSVPSLYTNYVNYNNGQALE